MDVALAKHGLLKAHVHRVALPDILDRRLLS